MKIVRVDNFDREILGVSDDKLICENVDEYYAPKILEYLNRTYSDDYSEFYFRLEADDYKLKKFEP